MKNLICSGVVSVVSVWGSVGLKLILLMNGKGLLYYYYERFYLNLMILSRGFLLFPRVQALVLLYF